MPIGPTTYFGKERVFVDREACIQTFRENIQNSGNLEYNVLFYHGIAGIGKSKLQKKLQKIVDEEYPEIFWTSIDLDVKTYRDKGTFLITLRNKIQENHSAKFQLFNAVHAIYWKKLHPEIPLQKQNYPLIKKGDILDKIIGVLENSGKLSLAWELLNSASDSFKKWCKLHHLDISKVESFEPNKIEELLPGIFAADFFEHFGENSKFYIFIDTYEALWDGLRDKGSFHEKDEWIRDNLIPNMRGVSWVICGREKLLWVPECDPDWKMYLEQYPVDELPEENCHEFLEDCGIEDEGIRNVIIKASERVPYYLNLSVDTYEKISKKRNPTLQDFGKTQPEIFNTFVKYLYTNEVRALEVLSAPNFWDQDLFEKLMKTFDSGFPIGAFSELIKFSFIKIDTYGRFSIHQLMRKSLQEHQNPVERKNVHKFMLEYYSNKLREIDIKAITSEHETALIETFYHAKEVMEAVNLYKWFVTISDPFYIAAFWSLITPIYEEMLQTLEAELGQNHRDVSKTLNDLAGFYLKMGEYNKSLPVYQKALKIAAKTLGSKNPDFAAILNNFSNLYESIGEYKKALRLRHRALQIIESSLAKEHPNVATAMNNIASLYEKMGEYEKALTFYQKALEIREKSLGLQHPDVATTINNLAELYREIGDYEEAILLCHRAFSIQERVLGLEHPDVVMTLNNLAGLYQEMGDYKEALPLYQKAFEIAEKRMGSEHPDIAAMLNNLASLYESMGEYNKALSLCHRSLQIIESSLAKEHPIVAAIQNNIAVLYSQIGKYEKALTFYQKALETREKILGPEHLDVATTLNNIAELYRQKGEYDKALPLYQRALNIREKVLGKEHPDIATTLNNIAELYRQKGEYDKALPLYRRALNIREKVFGSNHPDVALILNNFGLLYKRMGEYNKALSFYQQALDVYENMLGVDHPEVARTLDNLAELYRQIGEYEKALPLYQRALGILENTFGEEHCDTAIVKNNFAAFYESIGDYEKALSLLGSALIIQEKVLGSDHPDVASTLNNIADAYHKTGRYNESLQFYERSLDIIECKLGIAHPYFSITIDNLIGLYNSMLEEMTFYGYLRS